MKVNQAKQINTVHDPTRLCGTRKHVPQIKRDETEARANPVKTDKHLANSRIEADNLCMEKGGSSSRGRQPPTGNVSRGGDPFDSPKPWHRKFGVNSKTPRHKWRHNLTSPHIVLLFFLQHFSGHFGPPGQDESRRAWMTLMALEASHLDLA